MTQVREAVIHSYHLDWDSWSLKIEILQESQPTLRFALLKINAMEVSVCKMVWSSNLVWTLYQVFEGLG